MWMDQVFERFVEQSPFSVMTRATLEHLFADSFLDQVFHENAEAQYEKALAFSTVATLLTQVEVDAKDPAFQNPTKPIGPVYSKAEAEKLAAEKGWAIAPDGDKYRRVVASPRPKRIFEIRPIKWLLEKSAIVICAGGGGIPTMYGEDGKLKGIEAVIDKDLCSSLLAAGTMRGHSLTKWPGLPQW